MKTPYHLHRETTSSRKPERESEEEGDGHNALASAYGQSLIYFNVFNADDVQMAASLRGFSVVPFFLWLFISRNCLQMQVQCVCVSCVCVRVCRMCAVIIKLTVPPAVALFIQFQWVSNNKNSTSCSSRGSGSVGSITMPILMVITMRP